MNTVSNLWRTPGPWFGLMTGIAAPIAALASAGVISLPVAGVLMCIPAALTVPLVRSLQNMPSGEPGEVYASSAAKRYNLRMLAASAAYVAGLMLAVWIYNSAPITAPAIYFVALLPTAPALAMVFVMMRYLIEETDEYLRHRASLAALIGLGIVLCLGTIWGFLETFGLVPNIFAWWVVPVWAIGLGIGQATLARRDHQKQNR